MSSALEELVAESAAINFAKGKAEGKIETLLETIRSAMKNWGLTAEAAMTGLDISPEMQKELAPLI